MFDISKHFYSRLSSIGEVHLDDIQDDVVHNVQDQAGKPQVETNRCFVIYFYK